MKRGDGFVVLLELRIQVANKIVGIGFVGKNFGDVFKGGDSMAEVGQIFVSEAEVIPGVGVARELLRGGEQLIAGVFSFLQIEERDAEIEAGHRKFGIGLKSLLKKFLRIGGALLVKVSDAEGVHAQRHGGVVRQSGPWRLRGCGGIGSFLL